MKKKLFLLIMLCLFPAKALAANLEYTCKYQPTWDGSDLPSYSVEVYDDGTSKVVGLSNGFGDYQLDSSSIKTIEKNFASESKVGGQAACPDMSFTMDQTIAKLYIGIVSDAYGSSPGTLELAPGGQTPEAKEVEYCSKSKKNDRGEWTFRFYSIGDVKMFAVKEKGCNEITGKVEDGIISSQTGTTIKYEIYDQTLINNIYKTGGTCDFYLDCQSVGNISLTATNKKSCDTAFGGGDEDDKTQATSQIDPDEPFEGGCVLGDRTTEDLRGILRVFRIAAPLILLGFTIYEVVIAIGKGNIDAEGKKLANRLAKRFMYIVFLFFVPTLVDVVLSMADISGGCNLQDKQNKIVLIEK